MTKFIMHGCNGAMGQVITRLAKEEPSVEIVAGIDIADNIDNGYPVFTNPKDCQIEADVIVDFSVAKAVDSVLDYALGRKMPLVLCTTGLSKEQLDRVEEASKQIALLRSANMSLGVNTVFKLAAIGAEVLAQAGYDIEIVEKHHNKKLDAPSGTAIAIADAMNEVLNKEYSYKLDRSQERAKRGEKEIGIQAVRGGTIVGEHEVFFCGPDEVIEIKHTAYSKGIFAKGAIEAAAYLKGKQPGLYTMSDVIG
ncbi:MAG: 4-hydroxy-tetrahydrodipicolinate reductase [Clostridia bacterium]|nr:4-hydroxy-tetrahydrodipicolinate reductase [Lachnospiraceae bacterium]NCB99689.1 4-hydroxy-tetrahydrodipicolinate reductase [Clostridia bacterium]NCD01738.1 4-hydroxy-tetrahydrodipicolinate reductase [Clostridia bacterium]